MSYISLIVPAFHINTADPNEIVKYCCTQFNTSKENFNLIELNNNKIFEDKTHYGIIFEESNLSLQKIEQLIYERNCIQNLSDKAFESLQLITQKLNDLELLLNSLKEEGKNVEKKLYKKKFVEEEKNNNLIDIKMEKERHIDYSEKALKKIKIELKNMVGMEPLNKKVNNKKFIPKDIIIGKLNFDGFGHVDDVNGKEPNIC